MSGLEYAFVIPTVLTIFPLSLAQMKVSLKKEDLQAFFVWTSLSCLVACLPLFALAASVAL